MKTLITGATGFVGRHALERFPGAIALPRAVADLRKPLPELPRVERIVHCAAEIDDQSVMREVNVDGTARLVEWAVANGVRQFVYLSTGATKAPTNLYGITKAEGEALVQAAGGAMTTHIVRLYFPYGPGQKPPRLIPRLIQSVRDGKPVTVDAEGGPALSMTYIDDVTEALVRLGDVQTSTVVDVGGPVATLRQIAEAIGRAVGIEPQFGLREGKADAVIADTEALRAAIGYVPSTAIDDGIARCV